ncbi:MAG TPA: endonuclease III, partial [Phycisphaerae bacterium]|nr:endonuclease III [Phycisphaerae bacterium]
AACRLSFRSPFELLVATILSAQCTDDQVNKVTAVFFKKANTPQKIARLKRESLEAAFRSTGFFRNKAKSVHEMSRMLVEKYGGRVPREMEALLTLPGVARKTANVVRAAAFGLPAIITDTHFIRLSQRMGLTANEKPAKIEEDAAALLPESEWSAFSHALLFHGRVACQAKKPACDRCVVNDLCPSAFRFPPFDLAQGGPSMVERPHFKSDGGVGKRRGKKSAGSAG